MGDVGGLGHDDAVRAAAMGYVEELSSRSGGVVSRAELAAFRFQGQELPLVDRNRGIRNPASLPATLSIMTTKNSRYDDVPGPDGLLRYALRAGDPDSGDNRKLRRAYELARPLIWFQQVADGVFAPLFPVYLVADEPGRFVVAIGEDQRLAAAGLMTTTSEVERRYAERVSRQRLHQPVFRASVLLAYRTRCAVCDLRHADLLDAAHIIEDGQPTGDPVVSNGLALCKIHHAAYDRLIMGITPDLVVKVDAGVLLEVDGPMLKHGLQELHGGRLRSVPRRPSDKPDRERLAARYERFLSRAG